MRHLIGLILLTSLANAQPSFQGNWLGTLDAGVTKLRLALHVSANQQGGWNVTLDSLDQSLKGAPVKEAVVRGNTVRLDISGLRATYEGTLAPDGLTLSGTFTQGRSFPLEMRKVDKVDVLPRPQEPQAPFPYTVEEVVYPSRGSQLAGTLTTPSGVGPFPAAILISGSGMQDRDGTLASHKPFMVIADSLTRRGIAVLRVDDRGVGKSTGTATNLTLEDAAGDIVAGLDFLKQQPRMDAKRLGLIGHSEGGIVGPLVASRSADVDFLVLLAGIGVPGEEVLYMQAENLARAAGAKEDVITQNRTIQSMVFKLLRAEGDPRSASFKLTNEFESLKTNFSPAQRAVFESVGFEATLARRYAAVNVPEIRSVVLSNAADSLRQVKVPVLALNGARDAQVPAAQNLPGVAAALAAGGNTNFTIAVLPGLNHFFQTCNTCQPAEYGELEETFSPAALTMIGDWIVRQTALR